MKNYLATRTFTLMLLSIFGALIGAFIILVGQSNCPENIEFRWSSEFIVWFFANLVLFALYPILAVMLWKPLKQLSKYFLNNKLEMFVSTVIAFALFFFPLLFAKYKVAVMELPLKYAFIKIPTLNFVGFFAGALLPIMGIWLVQAAIRDTSDKIPPTANDVKEYICYRDYLQQFLVALGLLLSLFIITGVTLRNALIATGKTTSNDYPTSYLLVMGVYYTMMLALIYFPAYATLVSKGYRILDAYFALPAPDSKSWASTYARRQELDHVLELKLSGQQRFLTSITILLPLASSVLSLLS
jgi:hypothetical protein